MSVAPINWKPKRSLEECHKIMCGPGALWETEDKVIKGRAVRVFKAANQPRSLRDFWENTKPFAAKDYIVSTTERLTYAETHVKVEEVMNLLASRGVVKGDRVAIVMRNFSEWIIAFWAIHSMGAVSVAVNAWSLPDALFHCLKLSGSKVAIADHERAVLLAPLLPTLVASGCKEVFVVRTAGDKVPKGMTSFDEAVRDAPKVARERVEIDNEDNCCIFFTSGTTGMPKGVFSTQRQYLTNALLTRVSGARAILRRGEDLPLPDPSLPQKGIALATPLFHVTGNQSFLASLTAVGGKLYLLHKWDVVEAANAIRQEKLTVAGGVSFMVIQLIEKLGKDSSLESYSFGGGPAPQILPKLLATHAAPTVSASQAYGLTETNAIVTSHAGQDYDARPTSCGLPSPVNDFKIINMDTGATLPRGEIGEIVVRGPNIAEGYWENEKATKESFSADGWFRSGDVGYQDAEGWIFILDRAKEIIIRGGENISTITVEDGLYSHPAIRDAAVCPVPDYKLGELVTAFVTIKAEYRANPPSEAELIRHVATKVPKHCVPVMVHVSKDADIERNANGKTMKKEIKIVLGKIWEERNKNVNTPARL